MDALEVLFTRRSIRSFNGEPVSEDQIRLLLEAAMAAPTARNIQPWHFIVITDRLLLDAIAKESPNASMAAQAPLGILVCGDPSSPEYGEYWVQDCSAAMENILLAARAMNMGSCWCGIHTRPEREALFRTMFGIPKPFEPLGLAVIGNTTKTFAKKERYAEEKVHFQRW